MKLEHGRLTQPDLLKLGQPWALMMVGVPGSGKSTVAEQISEWTGATVLSSDGMRKFISGDANNQEVSAQAWQMLYDAAAKMLADGESVIIDGTHNDAEKRARDIGYYKKAGAAAVVAAWIDVDLELAMERNRGRERVVPDGVIEYMYGNIKNNPPSKTDGFDRVIVIDNNPDMEA